MSPAFTFCGHFSGTGLSAARWLAKLDYELETYEVNGVIPSKKYLKFANLLLTDEAVEWAESNSNVIIILFNSASDQGAVDRFKALLQDRFPAKSGELITSTFESELKELQQRADETLAAYYKKVVTLMSRFNARDRPSSTSVLAILLTLMKSAVLKMVMKAFVRDLIDEDIQLRATEDLATSDRSLRGVYALAETARKIKMKLKKMADEREKLRELQFYKSLVQKNMSRTQIEALLTTYDKKPAPASWTFESQGHIYEDDQTSPRKSVVPHPSASHPQVLKQIQPASRRLDEGSFRNSRGPFQPTLKELPDRTSSKNAYINGFILYNYNKHGVLCVKCGEIGHTSRDCSGSVLPAWEQSYLKGLVFGDNPQVSFVSAGYGAFDGASLSYWYEDSRSSSSSSVKPSSGSFISTARFSSITVDALSPFRTYNYPGSPSYPGPVSTVAEVGAKMANTFYEKGSGSSKRPHIEEEPTQSTQGTVQQPTGIPQMAGDIPYQF